MSLSEQFAGGGMRPRSKETSHITARDVIARLEEINDMASRLRDAEAAHVMEKNLWRDVLREVAAGGNATLAVIAALALESEQIKFSRWFA